MRIIIAMLAGFLLYICFQIYVGRNTLIADFVRPSQTIQFDIIGEGIDRQEILVFNYYQRRREVPRTNDRYTFKTGPLRGGKKIVFGETVHQLDPRDQKLVLIKWEGIGNEHLSLNDFESLPFEISEEQEKVYLLDKAAFIEIIGNRKGS